MQLNATVHDHCGDMGGKKSDPIDALVLLYPLGPRRPVRIFVERDRETE